MEHFCQIMKGLSFQSIFIVFFQALKQLDREKIQLATKFGIVKYTADNITVNGTPEYARFCCEASLKRLQVDYIDLYYCHRIDQNVPIEETVGDFPFCQVVWKKISFSHKSSHHF